MQFTDKTQYGQTFKGLEYPAPTTPLPPQRDRGMMIMGLSIFAGIMFVSLFVSGINVAITVVATASVYGVILTLMLLIDSGTLGYWLGKRAEEQTKREEIRAMYGYHTQRVTVESPHAPRELPAPPTPQLPAASTFVAPLAEPDDSVKREAWAWLAQLYGSDNQPDPKKVLLKSGKERPGRIRIASPSRPAKEYLLERRVIFDMGGTGYRLNIARCPTLEHAQNHISRFNGGGRSLADHPKNDHPLTVGDEVTV